MFSLISGRHVGTLADEHQHGVFIMSSINLREMFEQITRSDQRLGHIVYLITFYNIRNYQRLSLNGFEGFFYVNDVTVKTSEKLQYIYTLFFHM